MASSAWGLSGSWLWGVVSIGGYRFFVALARGVVGLPFPDGVLSPPCPAL